MLLSIEILALGQSDAVKTIMFSSVSAVTPINCCRIPRPHSCTEKPKQLQKVNRYMLEVLALGEIGIMKHNHV
jgi:hypothetical protein